MTARFPLRGLAIGTVLCIGAAYWGFYVANVADGDSWTGASLMRGPLFVLFCVVLANLGLRLVRPRLHLDQGELIVIYAMLVMGAAIGGVGRLDDLVPALAAMQHYEQLFRFGPFIPYAPKHLIPHDPKVIDAFFSGGHTVWSLSILRDWGGPILWWSSFIFVFIIAILCLQVLVRRQWFQNERLTFPLAYAPLAITAGGGREFKGNRLFWAGLGVIVVAQLLSGLNFYFPAVPHINLHRTKLTQLEATPPWSSMASVHLAYSPFLVAIAYFVDLDVSLSIWLLYVLTVGAEYLFTIRGLSVPALIGKGSQPLLAFMDNQGAGAYVGFALAVAWIGRRQLTENVRRALAGWERGEGEMLSYRASVLGACLGAAFLLWFMVKMGLALVLAIPLLLLMFAYCMSVSRLVAESGYAYYTPGIASCRTVLWAVGERNVPIRGQVALGYLAAIDQYDDNPAGQQITVMKLGEVAGMRPRHVLVAIVAGAIIGLAANWWAQLAIYYKYGAGSATLAQGSFPRGTKYFLFMQAFYQRSRGADWMLVQAVAFGIVIVAVLSKLHTAFAWFPLHPAGYLIASTSAARFIWLPFFLGWLIKSVIVRATGLAGYRRWIPFFLGVMVGDTVVPALFSAFAAISGQATYRFFP